MYTTDYKFLMQSSRNFLRIFISTKSRQNLKLGQVESKSRLHGQILENIVYTIGDTFFHGLGYFFQHNLSLKLVQVESKTRLQG